MGSLQKQKNYNVPAMQIFTKLNDALAKNTNFSNFTSDKSNLRISVDTPPFMRTHGERVTVEITAVNETTSTVVILSRSIQEENDLGQNKVNILLMFRSIEELLDVNPSKTRKYNFLNTDRKEEAKQLEGATKIVTTILLVVALVVGAVFVFKSCADDDNRNECGVCDGAGLVPNEGIGFSKCPYCKGSGIPPR